MRVDRDVLSCSTSTMHRRVAGHGTGTHARKCMACVRVVQLPTCVAPSHTPRQVEGACADAILEVEREYAAKKRPLLLRRLEALKRVPQFWSTVSERACDALCALVRGVACLRCSLLCGSARTRPSPAVGNPHTRPCH